MKSERKYHSDGRMIPEKGDRVFGVFNGVAGPVKITGICNGKTITITGGPTANKRLFLSGNWSVEGDPILPKLQKNEEEKVAKARLEKLEQEQLSESRKLEKKALAKSRLILTGWSSFDPDDHRPHLLAQIDYDGCANLVGVYTGEQEKTYGYGPLYRGDQLEYASLTMGNKPGETYLSIPLALANSSALQFVEMRPAFQNYIDKAKAMFCEDTAPDPRYMDSEKDLAIAGALGR